MNPTFLYDLKNGGIDSILRGMFTDPAQKVDGWVKFSFFALYDRRTILNSSHQTAGYPIIDLRLIPHTNPSTKQLVSVTCGQVPKVHN